MVIIMAMMMIMMTMIMMIVMMTMIMMMVGFVVDLFHSPGSAMIVASIGMLAAGFVVIIIVIIISLSS